MLQSIINRKNFYFPLILVIILGSALRLYSFYSSHLMFNSDGILYLQQAKALYLGQFDRFTACYPFPNVYPFFIVAFYWLTGHWVVAAKSASFVFGTATLIPLYFLLRNFFDRPMATCVLIFAAVNPVLVKYSSDVLRGPVCWFFVSLGMALLGAAFNNKAELSGARASTSIDKRVCETSRLMHPKGISCGAPFGYKRRWLFLAGSSLAFLFATWARIDAAAFLLATPFFFLLFGEQQRKIKDFFAYLFPLVVLGAVVFVVVALSGGEFQASLLPRDVLSKLTVIWDNYNQLRDGLKELGEGSELVGVIPGFFIQCRNLVLWIALGDVLNLFSIMSFQPFFLFLLFGFKNIRVRLQENVMLRYLVFTAGAAYLVVVFYEMTNWIMSVRFVILIFLSMLVFFGSGIERFVGFIQQKTSLQKASIIIMLGCALFLSALPKNMKYSRADEVVFREIGEFVAQKEGADKVITISGFFKRVNYINVFANLDVEESPCQQHILPENFNKKNMVLSLQKQRYDYFVWDEKFCSVKDLQVFQQAGLVAVGSWQGEKLGKMILFKL